MVEQQETCVSNLKEKRKMMKIWHWLETPGIWDQFSSAKGLFNSVLYLELFFMRKKLFTQRISNVLHWPDLDKT